MALSLTTLANELLKLFDVNSTSFVGWPTTVAQVATNWANAYDTYAKQAVDASGDSVAIANAASFKSTLQANLPTYATGTAALAAQAFDLAFISYWTGATFVLGKLPTSGSPCLNLGGTTIFSAEISSAVSVVTPGELSAALLTRFTDKAVYTAQQKANSIAQALHIATTTAVTVLITGIDTTPPPAGPIPILNTCGIS